MSATVQSIRGRAPNTKSCASQADRAFWSFASFFCLWACAISGRLFWLQIVRHQDFVERAAKQQQRTFEVAPRRGILYDRNLRELAMTVLVPTQSTPIPARLPTNRPPRARLPRWSTPIPKMR